MANINYKRICQNMNLILGISTVKSDLEISQNFRESGEPRRRGTLYVFKGGFLREPFSEVIKRIRTHSLATVAHVTRPAVKSI